MNVARPVTVAMLAITLASCGAPVPSASRISPAAATEAPPLGEQQQHEAGAVTVSAAWIAGTSAARVGLGTHSGDLDGYDLKELARVRLDGGAWTSPSAWDAPKGGHHRSGTLTFASLDAAALASARIIELEIRDVGVPSHLLRWERSR